MDVKGAFVVRLKADFSLASLREIDRFIDDQAPHGRPKPGGLLAEGLGQRIFGLGSYVGEVIRRQGDGVWHGDDADLDAEINISIKLKSGGIIWPVQRVMKRLKNGAEDGIYAYGFALAGGSARFTGYESWVTSEGAAAPTPRATLFRFLRARTRTPRSRCAAP